MFPFKSRWAWILKTGYLHLAEAIDARSHTFQEPFRSILEDRAQGIRVGVKVRAAVLLLLNVGIVMTALAWVARYVPPVQDVLGLLAPIAGTVTGISILLTAIFFAMTRYLDQLQANVIACMALGTPCMPALSDDEEDRVREMEDRAQETSWALAFPKKQAKEARQEEEEP